MPTNLPLEEHPLSKAQAQAKQALSSIEEHTSHLDAIDTNVRQLLKENADDTTAQAPMQIEELRRRLSVAKRQAKARCDALSECRTMLDAFNGDVGPLSAWLDSATKTEDTEVPEEVLAEKQAHFAFVEQQHQKLLALPNVSHADTVNRQMNDLRSLWNALGKTREHQHRVRVEYQQRSDAFGAQRSLVEKWLTEREEQLDSLPPVALLMALCQRQKNAMNPLKTEYGAFKTEMNSLNQLAEEIYAAQVRSKASPTGLKSEVEHLNARYDKIGVRILQRNVELDTVIAQLIEYEPERDAVRQWIADAEHRLNGICASASQDPKTAATQLTALQGELKKKRSRIDALKSRAHELTRLKYENAVPGLREMRQMQKALEDEFEALEERIASATKFLNGK